jgi:hypothetical protein
MGGTLNDHGIYLALHMFSGLGDRQWNNHLGRTHPQGLAIVYNLLCLTVLLPFSPICLYHHRLTHTVA